MQDDKLRHALEDLFSNVPPPEAETADLVPPEPTPPAPRAPEPPLVVEEEDDSDAPNLESALTSDVQAWRQRLVQIILYVLLIGGALGILVGFLTFVDPEDVVLMLVYTAIYLPIPLVMFLRGVPYRIKVATILVTIYSVGIIELAGAGLSGGGRNLLLTLPVLAVLLFGMREGLIALAICTLSIVGVAWAYSSGLMSLYPALQNSSASWGWWLTGIVIFVVMGTLLVLSQAYLIPRLTDALQRSVQLTRELNVQRTRLKQQTRTLQQTNQALRRRAAQLEASAEIGRAITSIFKLDQLFQRAVNLIQDRFGFYYVAIFLPDDAEAWAILEAASGEIGVQMKEQGHRIAVDNSSAVGWAAARRQSRVVERPGTLHPLLADTRCEAALPMMVGGRLLGVLDVHATEAGFLDADDVQALQGVADQIAIAIQNARRLSEEASLLEATSPVYRVSRRLTTALTPTEVANAIIASVAETEADGCVVVTFQYAPNDDDEPDALSYLGVWRRDREPDFKPGMTLPIANSPFPLEMIRSMWIVTDVAKDNTLPESARHVFEETNAQALVNIPLNAGERTLGQVVVLRSYPGPFSREAVRLYEALSDQASVAMERVRLMEEMRLRGTQDRLVSTVTARIRETLDVHTVLQTAAREIGDALQLHDVTIRLSPEHPPDRTQGI
ncbi:MAG: GAF domain-containing protein [Anaerolineae bacterium]|nr:GAF domain-containing protein [Anaerolineae bacterium]